MSHISEASDYEKDTQNARKETRLKHEKPKWEKPKTPKYLDGEDSMAMQSEEDH
jgi:hypothetical protein